MNPRKNSYTGSNINVSGIRGAIAQGLARAQHSAMDVRKSVVDAAYGEGSRRASFQPWHEKNNAEEPKIDVNPSDDIGCLSDFAGTAAEVDNGVYSAQDWHQQQSGDSIQIVVQEHVDHRWDVQRQSELPDVEGLHEPYHVSVNSQPRRGKFFKNICVNVNTIYK